MYLKSIEIQGFKSFANKIVFEFHNGITGIVGPNGSGKSNVADAVRWVLGEQRIKQLRGASMQDVIFSGTETRKPQGFAYVAITLDNQDHQLAIEYDEVTISRRVYRSGESEYMINKNACRLKDINELFYDTGIGKEGYSIIGQGQIDKILSGKPEERRELFDEAAGIVKFKRRKAIAQKKLEDEKQNLLRLSDILEELRKQVGPLERQSAAAKEYLRLKEELKKYDVNLFLAETSAMRDQIKALTEKEELVCRDLEDVKRDSCALKEEYDKLTAALARLDEEITAGRVKAGEADMRRGSLEGRIDVLNEQINTERMNEEHIKNRMASIGRELEEKEAQRKGYEAGKTELAATILEITKKLAKSEQKLEERDQYIRELEERIEKGKADIIGILNQKADLTARQQRYETMLEQVSLRRSEVCQKLLHFKSDESGQDELLKEERGKLAQADAGIEELKLQENSLEQCFSNAEEDARRLNRNLNNKQQEYHTNYTKLESLKNLAERYEGYGNSIRRVMEVKDRIFGIRGVVADLIDVPKEYEVAVETALGGSIQNVVTDSEQTAKQLIEYLKKNKYGRATFLPLTSIGNRTAFTQEKALKEPGVLGLAHQLVHVEKEYEGLARYLLGRVVVADTIDHAIALARKFQYSLRIVTLEGELFSAGGSMSGGAFKNSSNLLGRKREIEELEDACRRALVEVEAVEKELAKNSRLMAEYKANLTTVKGKLQAAYLTQNTLRMNISQIQAKKQEIQEASADMVMENQQLEEQLTDIRESKDILDQDVMARETANESMTREMEGYSDQMDEAKSSREEEAKEVSSIQLEAANLKQKNSFILENIKRIEEETARLSEEFAHLLEGTGDSKLAVESRKEEIESLKALIQEAALEAARQNDAIRELVGAKEEKSREQQAFFQRQEELSARMGLLDKELFRLQNQKDKLDERIDGQADYMWNEYEITYLAAEEMREESPGSVSEMKRQIESLKSSIRALGNVNVNAIEDYKEVSERYEFMSQQHDDLIQAEEALLKIITELDTGMRRQFEEKFREIRLEFDKVFRELFGGGHGTLELSEDEDILEAGIQIISQPPGKKLQNMMQLSGGEKALTAISLLFAIQNLKPSPFCLLDEIEAALDDSNVDRFAGYLHKLTANTQFIVITHRRGTMVASDRLYGITMQEKGVSTLVSVNLIENELDK